MIKKKCTQKVITTISSILMLSSCAGPESYQAKMSRYEPKSISKNQVPDFQMGNFRFKSETKNLDGEAMRSPASRAPMQNQEIVGTESNPTNKKLYFLSLLSEYENLKYFSSESDGPHITICPNFHNALLGHNDKSPDAHFKKTYGKSLSYDSTRFNDENYVASNPELLLPLSKEDLSPKVIDVIKHSTSKISEVEVSQLVHKAIDIHLEKTFTEIKELCEYGVSDNYYIYENLITHIKSNKFEADNKNMTTLLKTTIFSNMALMNSLDKHYETKQGRAIASVKENKDVGYGNEITSRLNVTWANQYFNYIKVSH